MKIIIRIFITLLIGGLMWWLIFVPWIKICKIQQQEKVQVSVVAEGVLRTYKATTVYYGYDELTMWADVQLEGDSERYRVYDLYDFSIGKLAEIKQLVNVIEIEGVSLKFLSSEFPDQLQAQQMLYAVKYRWIGFKLLGIIMGLYGIGACWLVYRPSRRDE